MELADIPTIQQTIAAVAQNYADFILPYASNLQIPLPPQPNRKYTIMLLGN